MSFNELKSDMQTRIAKSIESLKKEFSGLRTGRASTALLDNIMVAYVVRERVGQKLAQARGKSDPRVVFGIESCQ